MRAKQGGNKVAGLGLGLSICKRICTSLGGDIMVRDANKNRGSIFEFTLACHKDTYEDESESLSVDMDYLSVA